MKQKQCSNCPYVGPIYKNVTVDGVRLKLCKSCAMKHNAKSTIITHSIIKNPIPKRSKKRSKQERAYIVANKVFLMLERNKFCPVMAMLKGKTVRTTEVHHVQGRENEMLLDQEFWLAVCREAHEWIHANPEIAREQGWLI